MKSRSAISTVATAASPSMLAGMQAAVPTMQAPRRRKNDANTVVLPSDKSITIVSSEGVPLLEIASGEKGAEIRPVGDDLRIECAGHLNVAAGAITMEADDDVVVKGRIIRLN